MAVQTLKLSVTDAAAVQINPFTEDDSHIEKHEWEAHYGSTMIVHTDGELYWGGTNAVAATEVGNGATGARGVLQPAGTYSINYMLGDEYWVIAPTGKTVTVRVLAGSL